MRSKGVTLLKIVVSLGLVVFAFSQVDLALVRRQLASADLKYVLLALALYFAAIVVNGGKWQVLLRAQGVRVPFSPLLQFLFIGFFFNSFLPANVGGDVMRGYGLARYTDRAAEAAVSVVVDRIVGLMAYMSSAVVAAIVVVNLSGGAALKRLEWVAFLALLVPGVGFAILLSRRWRALITRLFAWRWLLPLAPIWGRVSDAFNAYRFKYRALMLAFMIGLSGIVCTALANWSLSRSMGGLMPLWAIFLVNPLIALVLMIPISIGGIGVSQMAYPFFFSLAGVPAIHALAVSLLMQLIVILGGLPGAILWLRGWRRQPARAPEGIRTPEEALAGSNDPTVSG